MSPSAIATSVWAFLHNKCPGVVFLGIMGDKAHQARTSDHNIGLALDVGGPSSMLERVDAWARRQRFTRYVIYKDIIWSPARGARAYTKGGHSDHVHISFIESYRDHTIRGTT